MLWGLTRSVALFLAAQFGIYLCVPSADRWQPFGPMGLCSIMAAMMVPTAIIFDAVSYVVRFDLFGVEKQVRRKQPKQPRRPRLVLAPPPPSA